MSAVVDDIKTKLSSAVMTPVYLCIALVIGAVIFFAVMRWNNDWAVKLFLNNVKTATDIQVAEQKKINAELTTHLTELEHNNEVLSQKLSDLSKDDDSAGKDITTAKEKVKGKTKSAVANEFKALGY